VGDFAPSHRVDLFIVTKVFGSRSTQLVGGAPINVGFGILILGLTIKLHWPIQSTDEETKDRNGRVTLTLKKAIVATPRFLIPVWAISFFLRVSAGVIVGKDFTVTGIPWIGGIPLDAIVGSTALVLTVKLLWPIWPTDEEMRWLTSLFSSSGSSTRSMGTRSSSQPEQNNSTGQSQTEVYPWASGKSLSDMTEQEEDWFWADEEGYFEGDDEFNDDM